MNKNEVIVEILKTAYKAVPKKCSLNGNYLIEIHNEIGSILDKYALGAVIKSVCPTCGSKEIVNEKEKWSCLACMDSGQTVS